MSNKKPNIVLLGAGGLAAFLLLKKNSKPQENVSDGPVVMKITKENFLPIDESFPGWYDIMAKLWPAAVHPYLILSDEQADQYLANYRDVREALVKGNNTSLRAAARFHWLEFGLPQKRTFFPLKVPHNTPYNGPGINYLKERSVGQAVGEMASYIATGISMFGGIEHELAAHEIDVIFNGAAIIKPILPFFEKDDTVDAINNKLTSILVSYSDR